MEEAGRQVLANGEVTTEQPELHSQEQDSGGDATGSPNGEGASAAAELIFKVANATVAACVYEAARGGVSPTSPSASAATSATSPLAAASPTAARSPVPPGELPGNSPSAPTPAPRTPQKLRGVQSTPQTWTSTRVGDGEDEESLEGDGDVGSEFAELEDQLNGQFRGFGGSPNSDLSAADLSRASPGSMQASPHAGGSSAGSGHRGRHQKGGDDYYMSPGGLSGDWGGKHPRSRRGAPPRTGGGTAVKENRPPLAPPAGSLKALPADHVQRFLRLVQDGDYNEALKAMRKVRRAVKGRGCSKEAFGGLRALLHHLLEAYASAGKLQEAFDFLADMKKGTEARLVSAAAFNALLRGLLARGALDEARQVVRTEMVNLGVSPNEASLNLLMDTAARAGPAHLDEAWDVLEEMQCRGLRADKYTVSILTKGISERGDKKRAPRGVNLVEHFLKTQADDVDEVLINSLLDVFCRMGDMPRLEATLQKMHEYGIKGSAVTYGTIVKAYGKAGNIEKVLKAWSEMGRLGLEANAVTYGCMLDACVKCGHLDKALEVFALMKQQGLHRNTILYATLIKGFAKSKDPSAARDLHREMLAEGVPCNVVVFNSLIDACVRASDLHGAAEVLQQMTSAGVRPDLITFSTLIKGYCSSGELAKAIRLAEELRARHLECDEIVYNSLLEGCVKAGDLQLGLRLFTEMRQRAVRPSSVTFSILVKLLSRAGRLDLACHLVAREMREMHGVTPTRMVWSCLVTCCVKARDLTRAVMVLDQIDREGGATGSARTSMYATVIEGCLAQMEVGIAMSLCERAYNRVPAEEGQRGLLSVDLLRRVFEATGARGLEAEARGLLDSISSRLSEQVRGSLEDALARGARRRSPRAKGDRDVRNGTPRVGASEASNMATLSADALSASAAAWSGGVVAAASASAETPQWPPYMPGAFHQGCEAAGAAHAAQAAAHGTGLAATASLAGTAGLPGSMPPMWDPSFAAGLGAWGWPPSPAMPGMPGGMPSMPGVPGGVPGSLPPVGLPGMGAMPGMDQYAMYGGYPPAEHYYGAGWHWPHPWGGEDPGNSSGAWPGAAPHVAPPVAPSVDLASAQAAAAAAQVAAVTAAAEAGAAAASQGGSPEAASHAAAVADTPTPEPQKGVETPSAASAGKAVDCTPATTAGRSSHLRSPLEGDADDEEGQESPLQMRLFAGDASGAGSISASKAAGAEQQAGKGTPMRVEVPLSSLLDGPPGLR